MPKEDYGALIITTAAVVSFLTFLLCILCQRKRKRRHHRQLHRNAHYDSTTSATGEFKKLIFKYFLKIHETFAGLSSSRRNLQSSLSGSVHGISSGSLRIPPAPAPPTSLPPPHVCISGGMIDDMNDPNDDMDDDDDEIMEDECQIHDMNVMDADLNNEPFVNNMNNANSNSTNNVNHYMNISSTINPNNLSTAVNDYYQNVMQLQNGESV